LTHVVKNPHSFVKVACTAQAFDEGCVVNHINTKIRALELVKDSSNRVHIIHLNGAIERIPSVTSVGVKPTARILSKTLRQHWSLWACA